MSKFRDLPPEAWVVRRASLQVSFAIHHSKCLQKDCLETQIWTFAVRPLVENRAQTHFCGIQRFTRSDVSSRAHWSLCSHSSYTLTPSCPCLGTSASSFLHWQTLHWPPYQGEIFLALQSHGHWLLFFCIWELTVCREYIQVWILGWHVIAEHLLDKSCILLATVLWS